MFRRHRRYASHAAGVRDAPLARRLPRRRERAAHERVSADRGLSRRSATGARNRVRSLRGRRVASLHVRRRLPHLERHLVRRRGAPHRPESAAAVPPERGLQEAARGVGGALPRRGEACHLCRSDYREAERVSGDGRPM